MDDTVGTTVLDIVVVVAKFSNPETLNAAGRKQTDCCFYSNGNDSRGHKRILSYMLNNELARNTMSGKLYNISFKYDSGTYAGKYKGSRISGKIKFEDFADRLTGGFEDTGPSPHAKEQRGQTWLRYDFRITFRPNRNSS